MRRTACLTFVAAAFLTAMFASSPLSLSTSPSSSWPQLTVSKAEAVTYRRARVATRRAYRRGAYEAPAAAPAGGAYYAHPDGAGGYPYSSGYYAYRGVYAPVVRHNVRHNNWGWHRPHWGAVRGWHWWR